MPHQLFTELRAAGPVHLHPPVRWPGSGAELPFWVVVGHPEIQQVNQDWETFSAYDGPALLPLVAERRGTGIVSMDPPDHTRLRKLVSAGFTPALDASPRRAASLLGPNASLPRLPTWGAATSSPISPISCRCM